MKKYLVYGCALAITAAVMSSCKSKEQAYRSAYEQAVAERQQVATNVVTPVQQTSPVEVTPVTPATTTTTTVTTTPVQDAAVRSENVTLVSGTGLKAFSVVVGSYSIQANAENQQADLKRAGYDAQVVLNPSNNMYRVVATTFSDKAAAIQSRDALRSTYAGAWLLYNTK